MKFAVSVAILVLLLGMPLGCILSASQHAAHPCCPRTSTSLKCPYDMYDSAKAAAVDTGVAAPVVIADTIPAQLHIAYDFSPVIDENPSDLTILHCILRI